MRLLTKKVPVNHNYFLFGDLHIGDAMCHFKGITKLIDHMQTSIDGLPVSSNIATVHGDLISAICSDDKRFDASQVGVPLQQAQEAVRILWPIRDQIVCVLQGNHERKLHRTGDLSALMCEQLGVEYGTYTAKITFVKRGGDVLYKHYATHGMRSISSAADDPNRQLTNKKLALKRHLKYKAGDCAIMSKGHVHKLLKLPPSQSFYLSDDGKQIQATYIKAELNAEYIHPDLRWYICTGSFQRLYNADLETPASGYAEVFEFDPEELGYYVVVVRDSQIERVEKFVV